MERLDTPRESRSPWRREWSLRAIARVITYVLSAVILVGAVALVLTTTILHRLTNQLHSNLESVRAAEEIELALLSHERGVRLKELVGADRYSGAVAEAERKLGDWLAIAALHVSTEEERRVLDDTRRAVDAYLARYREFTAVGAEPLQIYLELAPLLESAFASAEALVRINLDQAATGQGQAAWWDRVSNVMGVAIIAVLLAGGAILLAASEMVHRPLVALRHALAGFANRRDATALPVEGPREVRDIVRAFNAMTAEVEQHRQNRLRFLAGVAHDLRNPLGAITLALGTIPPLDPEADEEHVESTMRMIAKQMDVLSRMVTDLLDASRVESGQFELRLREYDARLLAQNAAELFRTASLRHRIVARTSAETVDIRCDPLRIEQVVNNLVSNAIKYSPAGGTVEIAVEATDGEVVLSVSDEGLGIAPEEQLRIFEPFRRGVQSRESIPGVGLGLSVARRIVEAHGGSIDVYSVAGRGSTFSIRLPRATSV